MDAPGDQTVNTPESLADAAGSKDELNNESEYAKSRSSKFRFKSSKSRTSHSDQRHHSGTSHHHHHHSRQGEEEHEDRRHRRRHHHHRSHHSSKRQRLNDEPPQDSPNHDERGLSPETAFRESLFDAMGDDEGAAFWESVYGQPIHMYDIPQVPKGPDGELERMTDEEYTAYVRARMWERSHEGIMEERERQRREKAKAKQRAEAGQRADRDRSRFNEALEESLQRGEKRRRAKLWKTTWEKYLRSWEELTARSSSSADTEPAGESRFYIRNHIYWPVESGKRRDISREAVREFMKHAPVLTDSAATARAEYLNTLKAERVRWHPDKMLHRYGNLGLNDEKTLVQSVTEVFQILDQLWIEERERHSKD